MTEWHLGKVRQECRNRDGYRYTKPSTHRAQGHRTEMQERHRQCVQTGTERIPQDQDTDPEIAGSELYTQSREATVDRQGHVVTKPQSLSQEAHSREGIPVLVHRAYQSENRNRQPGVR